MVENGLAQMEMGRIGLLNQGQVEGLKSHLNPCSGKVKFELSQPGEFKR